MDFRDRPTLEEKVSFALVARGQTLVSLEPEFVKLERMLGRAGGPLSVDAEAFCVTARYSDGSLQTYHWAYEPMSRGDRPAGLWRFAEGHWLAMP
jgi:hypothetical protein